MGRRSAGFAVLLLFLLALGLLAGCGVSGGSDDEGSGSGNGGGSAASTTTGQATAGRPSGETTGGGTTVGTGNDTVVIRVSGTRGTAYSGNFGTSEEVRNVNGTVGAGPKDYEIQARQGEGALNATFKKTSSDSGNLKVEVVVGGQSVAQGETSAELGSAIVNYVPRGSLPGDTTLFQEGEG